MQTNVLTDQYGRVLNYLRISVTDRCNFNCIYCREEGYKERFEHTQILSYEDILRIVRIGAGLGISKVRITGGEPLVRKGILPFLESLVAIPGIRDVSVTTNGMNLSTYLKPFKAMGISRLNISLDSLSRETFRVMSGTDGLFRVFDAIMKALSLDFSPVKINVVVLRGINDSEIETFATLTRFLPVKVRFIEYMPSDTLLLDKDRQVLGPEIRERIEGHGTLVPVDDEDSSRIADRFRFQDAVGELGIISPVSRHFCHDCNRLRLTANGTLRPCLLSDRAVSLKDDLDRGCSDETIENAFKLSARLKPGYSTLPDNRNLAVPGRMNSIGG